MRRFVLDYIVDDVAASPEAAHAFAAEFEALRQDRELLRILLPTGNSSVYLPCEIKRLIYNAQKQFHIDMRAPTDLHPLEVIEVCSDRRKFVFHLIISCFDLADDARFGQPAAGCV
jgi:DNA-directed RNA polymerase II subunit RPB1